MEEYPLHKAVKNNEIKSIEEILSDGYDINCLDHEGATPLYLALHVRSQESAILLLKRGAKYFKGESNRYEEAIILHDAAELGTDLVVKWLLENGSSASETNDLKQTPLHLAATEVVAKTLLELGEADVNAKCDYGTRPIHRAVNLNRLDVVKTLLDHGADVNATNDDGDTPLHIAAMEATESEELDILKLLIARGANLNAKTSDGSTALHFLDGLHAGDIPVAREILKHDVDIDAKDDKGHTPLHLALKSDLVKLYLERGADINILSRYNSTPLEQCYNDIKYSRHNGCSQAEIKDFLTGLENLVQHITRLRKDGVHVSDRNLNLLDRILSQPDEITYLL